MDKELKHYGTKRHSGRYPWGSGGHSQQRGTSFMGMVDELRKEGLTNTEISAALGIKTTEFHQLIAIEKERQRAADAAQAVKLSKTGMSNVAIGKEMGKNESTVRSLLKYYESEKYKILESTTNMLKTTIATKGPIDVGAGVEAGIGISRSKLNAAVRAAQLDGYQVMYVEETQLGTGKKTSIKVLAPPGMTYSELYKNKASIAAITDSTQDSGRTFNGLKPIQHISSDKIAVRYKDEGGAAKDGVIELRRGVSNLDLGNSKYAQVRIGVDGTHFLKGMAIYSDNLPDGVDIVYNVSKPKGERKHDVFKPLKDDPDNPFGTTIKYANGQRGALNIVYEEGDWREWSRNISSQVLSKQSTKLAQQQLNLAKQLKMEEFDEIMSVTNPAVKAQLLQAFADDCDASAVHLKAAALPRQASHVILPLTTTKENEVYAPMYENGERLALVRHPHGGTFEIPEVVVNNKNREAIDMMRDAPDAIGIHPKVAQRLSGADFDGDTVIAIPNKSGQIKSTPALEGLKDFDTKAEYPPYDGMKTVDGGIYSAATNSVDYGGKKPSGRRKQLEMGNVSNLITDMTIKGASPEEIARAVRHSMVVIDSEKHHLNYVQSALDNDIISLKQKYQEAPGYGASTVISRASSQERVPDRKEGILVTDPTTGKTRRRYIDPETGEKLYTLTGEQFVNKEGKVVVKQNISTKMQEAKSAFQLSSGTPMETIYANHADSLKGLANTARLELLKTPPVKRDPKAAKVYAKEVESLNMKLHELNLNKPKERQAQLLANKIYRAKLDNNPDLDANEKKRLRGQLLVEARVRLNAKKPEIKLTDSEWTAIQLGALSNNKVQTIIRNSDMDWLKEKSIPRTKYKMTDAKIQRAKTMSASGYTPAEIAAALGVSATTIVDTLNET